MKSCLIVDDSGTVRRAVRKMMEQSGFHCTEAEDGQKAIDVCEVKMPDIVILDWNMPVMNGIECLIRLRDMPQGNVPQVILCTTENDAAQIEKALAAGANEYIMKPFDNDILDHKLRLVGF